MLDAQKKKRLTNKRKHFAEKQMTCKTTAVFTMGK